MPLLSLYQFNLLSMDERAEYTWQYGVFITGVVDQQGRSNFYALGDYFVEVELFDVGHAIAGVVPFASGARHERMLSAITLPE